MTRMIVSAKCMRHLSLGAAVLLMAVLALGGCTSPGQSTGGDDGVEVVEIDDTSTDQMWNDRVSGAVLYVFPYEDKVITVEHPQTVQFPWYESLEEGKFYKAVADVTYLNGGIAGYVDYPEIEDVSSCEEIAPDNLNLPTTEENCYGLTRIGDYADGDLLFYEAGVKAVWKDGAWVYRYDRDLKFEDGTRALCREGVTEDDVRAGMEAGVRSCADYFVLP